MIELMIEQIKSGLAIQFSSDGIFISYGNIFLRRKQVYELLGQFWKLGFL